MTPPIERKVKAASAASALSGMILWVLAKYVFKSSVPDVFVNWTYIAVPAALAFAAGYVTKHTHRADLPAPPGPFLTITTGTPPSAVTGSPEPVDETPPAPPATA